MTPLDDNYRILKILKYWIENYWTDFSEEIETVERLTSFVDEMKDENAKSVLKTTITKKVDLQNYLSIFTLYEAHTRYRIDKRQSNIWTTTQADHSKSTTKTIRIYRCK